MPKVRANNITVNDDQHGTGEPLILIPYLAADYACYAFQVAEYPEGVYSTELFADDVAAFMQAVGIPNAHIFADLDVVAVTTGRDVCPLSKLTDYIQSSVKSKEFDILRLQLKMRYATHQTHSNGAKFDGFDSPIFFERSRLRVQFRSKPADCFASFNSANPVLPSTDCRDDQKLE